MHHVDLERDQADRVAVGRGAGDGGVTHDAVAAGAVDDVDRLAEVLFQRGGDVARDGVGAAAGGPGHDQRDRPIRKCSLHTLRRGHKHRQQGGQSRQPKSWKSCEHCTFLPVISVPGRHAMHARARCRFGAADEHIALGGKWISQRPVLRVHPRCRTVRSFSPGSLADPAGALSALLRVPFGAAGVAYSAASHGRALPSFSTR